MASLLTTKIVNAPIGKEFVSSVKYGNTEIDFRELGIGSFCEIRQYRNRFEVVKNCFYLLVEGIKDSLINCSPLQLTRLGTLPHIPLRVKRIPVPRMSFKRHYLSHMTDPL